MSSAAMKEHAERVEAVAAQVRSRPADQLVSIRKATPNHQARNTGYKASCHRVDVSALNNVLGFEKRKVRGKTVDVAVCEGQVTMDIICKAALPLGLVPRVVPEYNDFTVAGLINGQGIQTSCYKYGIFTDTIIGMEVVLGNGKIVECDAVTNSDLFIELPECHGTLGIVTRADVLLVPATNFVKSTYTHFTDVAKFTDAFDQATKSQEGDFLEGLVFARNSYLMVQSQFVEVPGSLPQYAPGPDKIEEGTMWYYQYTRDVVAKGGRRADVIPTLDFLFRSMRGLYWMMECHVDFPPLTNTAWGRRYCDKAANAKIQKFGGFVGDDTNITTAELERCICNQDMGINLSRLREGIEWVNANLGVFPLWICPVTTEFHHKSSDEFITKYPNGRDVAGKQSPFIVDIGIYGEPTVQPFYNNKKMRELMEFVDYPSLWGVSYLPKEKLHEFHRVPLLNATRKKYHAIGAFPDIDAKVSYRGNQNVKDEGPVPGWRFQRDYGRHWRIKVFTFLIVATFLIVRGGMFLTEIARSYIA